MDHPRYPNGVQPRLSKSEENLIDLDTPDGLGLDDLDFCIESGGGGSGSCFEEEGEVDEEEGDGLGFTLENPLYDLLTDNNNVFLEDKTDAELLSEYGLTHYFAQMNTGEGGGGGGGGVGGGATIPAQNDPFSTSKNPSIPKNDPFSALPSINRAPPTKPARNGLGTGTPKQIKVTTPTTTMGGGPPSILSPGTSQQSGNVSFGASWATFD